MSDNDPVKRIYDSLSSKFEMPDFSAFKDSFLEDPNQRKKAYQELSVDFQMPTFEKFESDLFNTLPEEKKTEIYKKDIRPGTSFEDIGNFFKGAVDLVANIAGAVEVFFPYTPKSYEQIAYTAEKKGISPIGFGLSGSEGIATGFFGEDEIPKTDKEKEERKVEVDKELHRLGGELYNLRQNAMQKYYDLGLADPKKADNFLQSQAFSFGLNLPFMLVGLGAAKFGLPLLSETAKVLAYPMFTFMESGSFAGQIYGQTGKYDEKGKLIPGSGDIDAMEKALPFGLLAGTLEFWGVSQAVGLIEKLGKGTLKGLGYKQLFKELGLVGLSEGGEEISQDAIEQLTTMGLNLQDKFSFEQSLQQFEGGAFGGILLGGFSIGTSVKQLGQLKRFAETVPDRVDKMEKSGMISKEKADNYKQTAKVVLDTPLDELGTALNEMNKARSEVNSEIGQFLQAKVMGMDVYDNILNSKIEDPYGRYEYAIPEEKTREQFLKRLEGSEEFQNLQTEVGKTMPQATPEKVLSATHRKIQSEDTSVKDRLKNLSLNAGDALSLLNLIDDGKEATDFNQDVFTEKSPLTQMKKDVSYKGVNYPYTAWGLKKLRDRVNIYNNRHNTSFILDTQYLPNNRDGIKVLIRDRESETGSQLNIHWERNTLTPSMVLSGMITTPEVIRRAKDILGDSFDQKLNEYLNQPNQKSRIKQAKGKNLQRYTREQAMVVEDFARRTVAANLMGETDINQDLVSKSNVLFEKSPTNSRLNNFVIVPTTSEYANIDGPGIVSEEDLKYLEDIGQTGIASPHYQFLSYLFNGNVTEPLPRGKMINGEIKITLDPNRTELSEEEYKSVVAEVVYELFQGKYSGKFTIDGKIYDSRTAASDVFLERSPITPIEQVGTQNPTQSTGTIPSVNTTTVGAVLTKFRQSGFEPDILSKWLFNQLGEDFDVTFANSDYIIGKDGSGKDIPLEGDEGVWVRNPGEEKGKVIVNRDRVGRTREEIWGTITHEGFHEYLHNSLQPGNKNFNLAFYNGMSAVMKEVKFRMDTDQNQFFKDNQADVERVFENVQEFTAYALARNSKLAEWMQSNKLTNNTNQTYWGKFISVIKRLFASRGLQSPTFMNAVDTILNKSFGSPAPIDFWDEIYSQTSDVYESMSEAIENYEKLQDPDNSLDNPRMIRSIGKMIADNLGDKPSDYIAYIQSLTFDQFRGRVLGMPEWTKAAELFYDTQKFDFTVGEFKDKLITQLYEYASSLELHPTLRLVLRFDPRTQQSTSTIEELGDYYRNKDNAIISGWRNKINMAERLDQIEQLTGIKFELIYLDDVKQFNGDKVYWKPINGIDFTNPDRNEKYAKLLSKHGILFPGTYSDKGTTVALRPVNMSLDDAYAALKPFGDKYNEAISNLASRGIKFSSYATVDPRMIGNLTLRLLTEDLRNGGQITEQGLQSVLFDPEKPESYNLIKIFKRPTDVAPKVATIQTPKIIEKIMKSEPVGIVEGQNGLEARTVIFNAMPDKGQWTEKVIIRGREVSFDMHDALVNLLGTETTDGNIYYLDEGLGRTYRQLHGIINPGGFKLWVGNSLKGDFTTPLFIKGFWQRISTKNLFGQWMKQNNVTALISSTSVKVNGGYKVSDLNKPDEIQVVNIPLVNMYRDKEKGVVKKSVRGLIQSITANLDTKNNPFFEGDYSQYYGELLNNLMDEFTDTMADMSPETILGELKEIAMNATSQYEQSLARIFLDIAYSKADEDFRKRNAIFFADSKDAALKKRITDTRLAKDLGGLFHEPYFAEVIKSRISKALHKVINHRGTASWGMFRPDIGYAEQTNIEALFDILAAKQQKKDSERLNSLLDEREILLGVGNDQLLQSVDKEIKSIKESLSYITAELSDKIWTQMDEYIYPESGRLKEGFAYISKDITDTQNMQALGKSVLTVVPSDGLTAQQAVGVIPIEDTEKGVVIANSEHTQTRQGKDFDGDSVHIGSYDPKYGTRKAWNKYTKTIEDTIRKHKELTLKYYRNVLKDDTLTEQDIYSKKVQLKFMQVLSESNTLNEGRMWNPMGSYQLLDLFAKDIGGVVNDRKFVTLKSQIGFSSEIVNNKRSRKFRMDHKRIPLYYLAAMRMTNDAVDKPNNENGLYYSFDDLRLAELMYGLNFGYSVDGETVYDDKDRPVLLAQKAADKFLFGYAIQFTSKFNLQDRGLERGLSEDLQYINAQQNILSLLSSGQEGKRQLAEAFSQWYQDRYVNQDPQTAQMVIRLGQQYILNAQIDNQSGSSLLNAISGLPLYRMPNIGTSRKVYIAWQYRLSRSLNKGREELRKTVNEKWVKAIDEFRSPVNKQYVSNFLLTSENPKLHLAKAILIDFILPVDQRLFKAGAHEGMYHTDIFNKANQAVYPRLIQLLFEGKTFQFNKEDSATLSGAGHTVRLSRSRYNGIQVDYTNPQGEKMHWASGYELLHQQTEAASKVRNLLFHSEGLFSTYQNRYNFSQFISFGRNISSQGRLEFAKDFLNTVLPKFTEDEKALFWDSLTGYPDPEDRYGISKEDKREPQPIRTPMNLAPYSINEHPDQKTLLQLAALVDDGSGRQFLKRYAKTATEEYPGLGLDQSIEILNSVKDGPMSEETTILHTRDYRDDVNDESKSFVDRFKTIFDIIRKSDTRAVNQAGVDEPENFGVYPRLFSGQIGRLTALDVTQTVSTHTTRTATAINDEMIALKKAERLLGSVKVFDYHLRVSYNRIEAAIQELRATTGGNRQEIISRINLLSENFFGIDFQFNELTGQIGYNASNGAVYSDKEIDDMLAAYNVPRAEYGYYKAALELRKIYDYWNPRMLRGTVNYLEYLRNNLPEGFVNTPIVDQSIRKWTGLLEQMTGMSGRYFPRMFEAETYNQMAEDWALWNVISEMFPEEERQRRFTEARDSGNLSEEVQRRVNQERVYLTVDRFDDFVYSWQHHRVILDWLAEGRYITDTMDMHSKHMRQLQNAIVSDITRTEWLLYEHNASVNEQTKDIITQMRGWFGNLSTDNYLKSDRAKVEDLKQSDQVAFYYRRGRRESFIRGEVLSKTDRHIFLSLDAEQAEADIRRRIERYNQTHDQIVNNTLVDPNRSATVNQMDVIDSLVDQDYLDEGIEYTLLDANDAIIRGLTAMLTDRENWGRFDLNRVYIKQYRNQRGIEVSRKVLRSVMRGNPDKWWQGFQLLTSNIFLGNPGAGVRNYIEAKYRIIQSFGWLRYFNLPGVYYNLVDSLPERIQALMPLHSKIPTRTQEIYSGIRERSKEFVTNFVTKAKQGDTADFYTVLYPVIRGQKRIVDMVSTEKMDLVGAVAAKFIMENGLAGKADIGNAFVREVGEKSTTEIWKSAKGWLMQWFLGAEGRVRREAAFLFAYKAVFYDGITKLSEIENVVEKGVGFANSLYDMMYRKLGEGSAAGKVAFQFSQFNTYQAAQYKQQLRQAMELGQLKEVKSLDDMLFNLKAFLTTQQVIQNSNGTTTVRKINDSVDPYIPGQMAKFFWQDSLAMVFEMAVPGLRAGNPVNRLRTFTAAMILNMILTGELPSDWDLSDWLFTLLGFRFGLGLTFPVQMLYNLIAGREKIVSAPKMTTFAWDAASNIFSEEGRSDLKNEWYMAGQASKFALSVDLTPHTRQYYTDEQNELTGTLLKKFVRPFIETQDIGGFNIPLPSPDLVPVVGLARYKRGRR